MTAAVGGVIADGGVLLFGLSAVLVGLAALILVWRRGFQSVTAKLHDMSITLEGIDKQVNRVPKGSPTIPETLAEHTQQIAAMREEFVEVRKAILAVKTQLIEVLHRSEEGA